MTTQVIISYDPQVDAMAIDLDGRRPDQYHRTKEVTGNLLVDLNHAQEPIGIEILNVTGVLGQAATAQERFTTEADLDQLCQPLLAQPDRIPWNMHRNPTGIIKWLRDRAAGEQETEQKFRQSAQGLWEQG